MSYLRNGMLGILALCGLVWIPAPAAALDAAPDQFERMLQAYDPETVAAARAYARVFDMKGMMEKSVPAMRQALITQLKAKNPTLNEQQMGAFLDAFFRGVFVDGAPVLEQATVLLMLEVLSKDEIIALNQFYSSPVGREILSKMPVIMGRMPEIIALMQKYVIPGALEAAQATMKKGGVDVRI
jgi:hypothetical protein